MKQLHLDALRDIAIQHIPKARGLHSSPVRSHSDVCSRLHLLAKLSILSPTASALERAAAHLLEIFVYLSMPRSQGEEPLTSKQRKNLERLSIEYAHDLFELEGREAPAWLPPAQPQAPELDEEANPRTAPEPQATIPKPSLPPPGINLTTKEAARLLNRADQTLRSWASKENGPLRPIRTGKALSWPSDEVRRLMRDGW